MSENRIIEVKLSLQTDGNGGQSWLITMRKEFAPENGGGTATFSETANGWSIHRALDVAREMVTMSPARNTS